MTQKTIAYPQFSMFSREQCEIIHNASLEILRRTGVRVYHEEALALLRQTDAVITDTTLVYMPPQLVEWALAQAPSRIVLCKRGSSEVAARLEGREVSFGTGSDCRNYLDPRTGSHRLFNTADVIDCIHVVDALPEIDFCMSMGVPVDAGEGSVFQYQFALMLEHTTKPIVFVADNRADCAAIVAMAAAAAGGAESLRLNPNLLSYSQCATPLKHPADSLEKLLCMAENMIPTVHAPSPMMGGTAPVTMAGALALGNAEILSGLVIHQLQRAGAPFLYGSGQHHMDMKTTISVYSAPEFEVARVAIAEMARFYGLPNWGYAGHSDSCVVDEQATADAAFSVLASLLAGANLVHDIGYLEAGLTASPELVVFTAEIIGMLRHFVQGVAIDAETLALEVIHKVGPGGDFLTEKHTLKRFREFWQPSLYNRYRMSDWLAKGSTRLGTRLRDKTIAIMDEHQPEPLPDRVKEEIGYILKTSR